MSSSLLESILPGKSAHMVTHPHRVGYGSGKTTVRFVKKYFRISFLMAEKIWRHPDNMLKLVRSMSIVVSADVLEGKCFKMLLQLLR